MSCYCCNENIVINIKPAVASAMTSSATKIHDDLDSSDSVDVKNGLTYIDWTPDTRDTE